MGNRVSTMGRIPAPPAEYDPAYMNRLVGLIEQHLQSLEGRRLLIGTTANLSDLPTSATGLRSGDLWRDGDTIKIVS